jgi:hypothetical protein
MFVLFAPTLFLSVSRADGLVLHGPRTVSDSEEPALSATSPLSAQADLRSALTRIARSDACTSSGGRQVRAITAVSVLTVLKMVEVKTAAWRAALTPAGPRAWARGLDDRMAYLVSVLACWTLSAPAGSTRCGQEVFRCSVELHCQAASNGLEAQLEYCLFVKITDTF